MNDVINHTDDENYTLYGDMDTYQEKAVETAIYDPDHAVTYPLIGLVGEVGEFANKYKKVLRDGAHFTTQDATAELGDILWYIANLANDLDISLSDVAYYNVRKLRDRQARGVLGGSGDER